MNQQLRTSLHFYLWWFAVAIYVALLPYAIVIFNYSLQQFSLSTTKQVPLILLLTFACVYSYTHRKKLHFKQFIFPSIIILIAVVQLESNPIKYIHIPEYMLLSWILFKAIHHSQISVALYVSIVICTSLLGIIDELHQGIHPERYYGWKDMLINTAGGIIGVLLLNSRFPITTKSNLTDITQYSYAYILCLFCLMTTAAGCYYLLKVQHANSFVSYPNWVITANTIGILIGISYGIMLLSKNRKYRQDQSILSSKPCCQPLIYYPLIISNLANLLIVYITLAQPAFK